jgi:hypothetical protein
MGHRGLAADEASDAVEARADLVERNGKGKPQMAGRGAAVVIVSGIEYWYMIVVE